MYVYLLMQRDTLPYTCRNLYARKHVLAGKIIRERVPQKRKNIEMDRDGKIREKPGFISFGSLEIP